MAASPDASFIVRACRPDSRARAPGQRGAAGGPGQTSSPSLLSSSRPLAPAVAAGARQGRERLLRSDEGPGYSGGAAPGLASLSRCMSQSRPAFITGSRDRWPDGRRKRDEGEKKAAEDSWAGAGKKERKTEKGDPSSLSAPTGRLPVKGLD